MEGNVDAYKCMEEDIVMLEVEIGLLVEGFRMSRE